MLQQITKENLQQMMARFSTVELENLVVKFPYFQQAHLLLAKKYQQENSRKFDQQLQLAALYTQDRELFYNIFNDTALVKQQPPIAPLNLPKGETLIQPEVQFEIVAEKQPVAQAA